MFLDELDLGFFDALEAFGVVTEQLHVAVLGGAVDAFAGWGRAQGDNSGAIFLHVHGATLRLDPSLGGFVAMLTGA